MIQLIVEKCSKIKDFNCVQLKMNKSKVTTKYLFLKLHKIELFVKMTLKNTEEM